MNTNDLAKSVAESQGLSGPAAKQVVDALLASIADTVASGEEVNLPGFGKFKVKDMPERGGRNPSTGEAITIAASKKLTFTPAKAMKDRL
jgi:DNA-binding protein HU-beta